MDNKFYVLTGKESKKTSNLKRNQMVYFCVDNPKPTYKEVRGKGIARIQEDVNFNISIWEKIMVRYIGNLEDQRQLQLKMN